MVNEFEYHPSMESEIKELLPDDMLEVESSTEVMNGWKNHLMNNVASEADKILMKYPNFGTIFTNKLISELTASTREFVKDFLGVIQLRLETTRQTAIDTILSSRYPAKLRGEMLEYFDNEQYERIAELSLGFDVQHRERPNKGKQGPEDPLQVGEELHHIKILSAEQLLGVERLATWDAK